MKLIVDIKVQDLDRANTFYRDVLGLTCRRSEKDWSAFKLGDAEIHLYIHSGLTGHVEFYIEDIDQEVMRLRERGIEFLSGEDKPQALSIDDQQITTFPWGRTAFFNDSEGNELAIVKDTEQ